MEAVNFLNLFVYSNLVLFFFLLLIYIYFTNTSLLRRRGYSEEFIKFKKKDYKKRIIGMSFAIPILQLIAGLITFLIFGELENSIHLLIIFIIFLVLTFPFSIIDTIKTARKHEKLMVKTQSSVVVDFKYKTFNSIFNPFLELIATVLILLFYIVFIRYTSPLITVHLALIWFIFLMIRRGKNMNKPLIRETYYYAFVILILNHLLIIFHLIYPFISKPECCNDIAMIISGLILSVLLIFKFTFYLLNIPYINKELR